MFLTKSGESGKDCIGVAQNDKSCKHRSFFHSISRSCLQNTNTTTTNSSEATPTQKSARK